MVVLVSAFVAVVGLENDFVPSGLGPREDVLGDVVRDEESVGRLAPLPLIRCLIEFIKSRLHQFVDLSVR